MSSKVPLANVHTVPKKRKKQDSDSDSYSDDDGDNSSSSYDNTYSDSNSVDDSDSDSEFSVEKKRKTVSKAISSKKSKSIKTNSSTTTKSINSEKPKKSHERITKVGSRRKPVQQPRKKKTAITNSSDTGVSSTVNALETDERDNDENENKKENKGRKGKGDEDFVFTESTYRFGKKWWRKPEVLAYIQEHYPRRYQLSPELLTGIDTDLRRQCTKSLFDWLTIPMRVYHVGRRLISVDVVDNGKKITSLKPFEGVYLNPYKTINSDGIVDNEGPPHMKNDSQVYLNAGGPIWTTKFSPNAYCIDNNRKANRAGNRLEQFIAVGVSQIGWPKVDDAVYTGATYPEEMQPFNFDDWYKNLPANKEKVSSVKEEFNDITRASTTGIVINGVCGVGGDYERKLSERDQADNILQIWSIVFKNEDSKSTNHKLPVKLPTKKLGRPRKYLDVGKKPKGPKGRPRKYPRPAEIDVEKVVESGAALAEPQKKRGRPRKRPLPPSLHDKCGKEDEEPNAQEEKKTEVQVDESMADDNDVTMEEDIIIHDSNSNTFNSQEKEELKPVDEGEIEDVVKIDTVQDIVIADSKLSLKYAIDLRRRGPTWSVAWAPLEHYDTIDSNLCGILAVLCGDGSCLILHLPKKPQYSQGSSARSARSSNSDANYVSYLQGIPLYSEAEVCKCELRMNSGVLFSSISWSPVDPFLVCAGMADGAITFWDLRQFYTTHHQTKKVPILERKVVLDSHTNRFQDLNRNTGTSFLNEVLAVYVNPFYPKLFMSAGKDNVIRIWNRLEPFYPAHVIQGANYCISDCQWDPLGLGLYYSSTDSTQLHWEPLWNRSRFTFSMRKNLYYHEHQLSGVWSTTLFPNDGTTVLISAASDGTVRGCITSWIAGIKKLVMKDLTFELFKVHSIINPPSEGIDLLINFPNALDDYKEEALQICKKMKASRARGLSKDDIAVKSTLHEDNLIAIDHHKTFYKLSIDSFFNISVDNAEVHVSGVRTSFNEKNYSKPTINKDSTCAIHAIDSTFFTNYSCNESDDVSQWNELNRQSRDCQLIMYGGASGLVHIQVIDPYNIFTASNADKDVAGYKL